MSREVPEGWRRSKLGDLIQLEYGKALAAAERREGDVPVFGSSGIVGYHDKAAAAGPSIVISRKGSLGGVFYVESGFWPIDTTYFVAQRENSNWRWLTYLLKFASLERLNEATGVPGLNRDKTAKEEVFVPPLHEQRRIAEILSSVDEAIAATRAVIEQTRKVKQGMLERLLTKGIGHTRFKQTEIGEIPEGWAVAKFGEIFKLTSGKLKSVKSLSPEQSDTSPYPAYGGNGVAGYTSECLVDDDLIVIGRVGEYCGSAYRSLGKAWITDNALYTKEFLAEVDRDYVHFAFSLVPLMNIRGGGGQPLVSQTAIYAQVLALPKLDEQRAIVEILKGFENTASDLHLSKLIEIKSALMSDLLTGRKRVTDALPVAAE
ncbi:restriction endonuclease subunit S [Martelella radicis]|uniref:Type I restriction enzyme S subunit n=1 Tax=Martelella radicis TaxID=1397476 RepID=A0A7W6KKG0_9HYPH|nr:restriction endonuclease subunit S [Martelella radicis]MBB4122969.1 type I restriction enzyme S subunit [Martelella radicis]